MTGERLRDLRPNAGSRQQGHERVAQRVEVDDLAFVLVPSGCPCAVTVPLALRRLEVRREHLGGSPVLADGKQGARRSQASNETRKVLRKPWTKRKHILPPTLARTSLQRDHRVIPRERQISNPQVRQLTSPESSFDRDAVDHGALHAGESLAHTRACRVLEQRMDLGLVERPANPTAIRLDVELGKRATGICRGPATLDHEATELTQGHDVVVVGLGADAPLADLLERTLQAHLGQLCPVQGARDLEDVTDAGHNQLHVLRRPLSRLDAGLELVEQGQLALSGPQCNSQPLRTTAATFSSLVSEAQSHVLVTGYVAVNAKKLLEPLAKFLDGNPSRSATLVLDFQRGKDTTVSEQFAARKADEFWTTEWPASTRRPNLWYDTRSLVLDPKLRTSMHAKVVVADRRTLFVTSANLTHRAHSDNIELGLVLRHAPTAQAVVDYFEGLMHRGVLASCSE